jgi:hypothetical protein
METQCRKREAEGKGRRQGASENDAAALLILSNSCTQSAIPVPPPSPGGTDPGDALKTTVYEAASAARSARNVITTLRYMQGCSHFSNAGTLGVLAVQIAQMENFVMAAERLEQVCKRQMGEDHGSGGSVDGAASPMSGMVTSEIPDVLARKKEVERQASLFERSMLEKEDLLTGGD